VLDGSGLELASGTVSISGRLTSAGEMLREGQTVVVGGGRAVVRLPGGTVAVVDGHSSLVLPRRNSGRIRFVGGRVTFQVPRLGLGQRLVVELDRGRVEVLGTVFAIVSSSRNTQIQVVRGEVRFVEAGRSPVPIAAGRVFDPATGFRRLTRAEWNELTHHADVAKSLSEKAPALLLVDTHPPGAELSLDGQTLGWTPLSVRVPAGLRKVVINLAGYAPMTEHVHVPATQPYSLTRRLKRRRALATAEPADIGSAQTGLSATSEPSLGPSKTQSMSRRNGKNSHGKSPDSPEPTPSGPVSATPSIAIAPIRSPAASSTASTRAATPASPARTAGEGNTAATVAQLLKKVGELRARRDWTGVVRIYRKLIREHSRSAEARTCLVLMGQVQLFHLKRPSAALRSFDAYLKRSTRGNLAQEAAWGRALCLRRLKRTTAEIRALNRFLRRFPSSVYAGRAGERLRALARKK
jgi:hypothetical protein